MSFAERMLSQLLTMAIAVAMAWAITYVCHVGWDRALLIQCVWLLCVTRAHQENA